MLRWAGLGVAVAEASDEVRAAAGLVVPRDRLGELFETLVESPIQT
jgi:hydroxymethylpyrimidine pyrophosphatase-like HAD family hydrolase